MTIFCGDRRAECIWELHMCKNRRKRICEYRIQRNFFFIIMDDPSEHRGIENVDGFGF